MTQDELERELNDRDIAGVSTLRKVLIKHRAEDGGTRLTMAQLSKLIGRSERTVQRYLRKYLDANMLYYRYEHETSTRILFFSPPRS